MSSDQSDLAASRPPPTASQHKSGAAPSADPQQQVPDGRPHDGPTSSWRPQSCYPRSCPSRHQPAGEATQGPHPDRARDIVRLFQCRQCSAPYENAVTLPCGRSVCRTCLPELHTRTSITYPALPSRIRAFRCPFRECGREHVLDDCGSDVILNKVAVTAHAEMDRAKAEAARLGQSTRVRVDDAAGPQAVPGTPLVATWNLATQGGLGFEADVVYGDPSPPGTGEEADVCDAKTLERLQEAMRGEMDCQVCYAIFYNPLTTGCGHTFCRPCLHRVLDYSQHCPTCRRKLDTNPLLKRGSSLSNERLTGIMDTFWRHEVVARHEAVVAERAATHESLGTPLFVCTLSFPMMPTFLHVFEPQYRLMIRRALEGDKTFGMVLPRKLRNSGDAHFHEIGTLLRIVNAQFYPDGRSLIETVGLSRFRVLRHGNLDGYTMARTERVDDVSLEEEEAKEAAEVGYHAAGSAAGNHGHGSSGDRPGAASDDPSPSPPSSTSSEQSDETGLPQSSEDLDAATTQSLMRFATAFVARMRQQSVPWLTDRMLAIYGDCPEDPAVFPWWFASTLPVKDIEKYRLLGTSSVRDRLKICGSWILEMKTVRWSLDECVIL